MIGDGVYGDIRAVNGDFAKFHFALRMLPAVAVGYDLYRHCEISQSF